MPTYDYNCKKCGDIEIFHPMSAKTKVDCPECGTHGLEKQISAGSGIIFKGSGFYETDYKRAGTTKETTPTKESTSHTCSSGGCGCST